MAILVNIGQRGFVLKEGFLGPTQQVTVDPETAEKLSKMYPNELKVIVMDEVKAAKPVESPVPEVHKAKEEPTGPIAEPVSAKAEEPQPEPKKAGRGRKKKEVQ